MTLMVMDLFQKKMFALSCLIFLSKGNKLVSIHYKLLNKCLSVAMAPKRKVCMNKKREKYSNIKID